MENPSPIGHGPDGGDADADANPPGCKTLGRGDPEAGGCTSRESAAGIRERTDVLDRARVQYTGDRRRAAEFVEAPFSLLSAKNGAR